MPRKTDTRFRILNTVRMLRLSDVETMQDLIVRPDAFPGRHGVEKHLYRLLHEGVLRRLYLPTDPTDPYQTRRNKSVFMLGVGSYDELGITKRASLDNHYNALSQYGERIYHELGIAIVHGAFLKAEEAGYGELTHWEHEVFVDDDESARADALFRWNGTLFALEFQNRKRLMTDAKRNGSAEKQIVKYSRLDKDGKLPNLRVLFVTRERRDPSCKTEAETTIAELFSSAGYLKFHDRNFFQVTSLTFFKRALKDPKLLLTPFITNGHGELLAIPSRSATLKSESARPALPTF